MQMPTDRTVFLGTGFDRMAMDEVLRRLSEVSADDPYRFVVTPNVDHIVQLHQRGESPELAGAYAQADFSVCDSRVLMLLARLNGERLPVVPGSDLTARLFYEVIRPGDRVAIVGGDRSLIDRLKKRYPDVDLVHHEPPMGLRSDPAARDAAARFIAGSKARFAFISVGTPQQEMIAAAVRNHAGATGLGLCIGASLDFIVGRQKRAPRFFRVLSMEWAYRLMSEPRRLWRRYLIDGPKIFAIVARYRRADPRR